MPDVSKGGILALVPKLQQHFFQQSGGIGVEHQMPPLAPLKEFIGISVGKLIAAVNTAGSQSVTEHFRDIFYWHFDADDALAVGAIVRPVFKMVAVAPLVVHPGGGIALFPALGVIGAAVALKIADPHKKFLGGVFGQVMGQALPVKSQTEAVFPYQPPVVIDGFQMCQKVQRVVTSLESFHATV